MIIDIHTHAFPDKIAARTVEKLQAMSHTHPFTDGSVSELRKSMQRAGIGLSVVQPVATNARQVPHINDSAIALNERTAETGVLSFGCMHPEYPDWTQELSRLAQNNIKGIKLHPVYQETCIDDPRFLRILDRCAELGLVVLTHAGKDVGFPDAPDYVSPAQIANAMRQTDGVTMICAHMGGWRQWEDVERLLPETGVYLDTSFSLGAMTPNGDGYYQSVESLLLLSGSRFLRLIETFGANRVLFGTDSPWSDQQTFLNQLSGFPFIQADLQLVLGGNAAGLLNLS